MLLPFYSIGSDAEKIESSLTAEFLHHFEPVYLTRPGQTLPVILPDQPGKIDAAIWGIPDKNGITQAWTGTEGIIRNRYRYHIRKQRCLIPANGYFITNAEKIYFIYFPDEKVVTLGGIYLFQRIEENQQQLIRFSILLRPVVSGMAGKMPLIVPKSSRRRYLNPLKPLMEITRMFRKEAGLKLNGLEVSEDLFGKKNPQRSDFKWNGRKLRTLQHFPEKEIMGSYIFY